jgi:large subunit ribosomal protein L22
MLKYSLNLNPKKSAKAYGRSLPISEVHSKVLCRKIGGMNVQKGIKLLEGLANETLDLEGKHYTKTAETILALLKSAEKNAESKGLDTDKLVIFASAHQSFSFFRPRRSKMKRQQRRAAHIQIVLRQS